LSGLVWEAGPETGADAVFFFPTAFFDCTLGTFQERAGAPAQARISVDPNPEGGLLFRAILVAAPGNAPSRQVLDWLQSAWIRFGATAGTGEGSLDLTLALPQANRPETDRMEQPLNWFTGKSLLVGPASYGPAALLADELRRHGAETTMVPSVFALNGQLAAGWFHLIVWLSDQPGEISEINPRTLQESGLKMLVYGPAPAGGPLPEEITFLPPPSGVRQAMEQVWNLSHAAAVRKPSHPVNPAVKAFGGGSPLRFDRFLEITEGDKSFMKGLLPSYFTSLQECHEVFSAHIKTGNLEGLRFLLHKIRATVNTFEIYGLDAIIREAIDRIADGVWKPETDSPRFTRKLDRICRSAEDQLREFAREQGLNL
jgi:hypothetical protein